MVFPSVECLKDSPSELSLEAWGTDSIGGVEHGTEGGILISDSFLRTQNIKLYSLPSNVDANSDSFVPCVDSLLLFSALGLTEASDFAGAVFRASLFSGER